MRCACSNSIAGIGRSRIACTISATAPSTDRSQVRKRAAPHMMASLRNLAIGLLRLAGASTNIAAAARFFMRHTERAMELFGVPSLVVP